MKKLFYAAIFIVSSTKLNAVFTPPRETRHSLTQSLKIVLRDTLDSLANQEITKETIQSLLFNIEILSEGSSEEIKEIAAALAEIPCKETELSVEDWLDSSEKEMPYLNEKLNAFLKKNGCSNEFLRREILNIVLTEIFKKVDTEMEIDEDNALAGNINYLNLDEEDPLAAFVFESPTTTRNIQSPASVRKAWPEQRDLFQDDITPLKLNFQGVYSQKRDSSDLSYAPKSKRPRF